MIYNEISNTDPFHFNIPGTEHSWQRQDEAVNGLQLVPAGLTSQVHSGNGNGNDNQLRLNAKFHRLEGEGVWWKGNGEIECVRGKITLNKNRGKTPHLPAK